MIHARSQSMKTRYLVIALILLVFPLSDAMTQNTKLADLKEPRLVIKKSKRQLLVFDADRLVKTYRMGLGFSPDGTKSVEGDGKTPEGEFYVFTKNPNSRFHLSLGISYPGIDDAKRGLEQGLITQTEYDEIAAAIAEKRMPLQKTKLGGEIYIHGGGISGDWTEGCVALDNAEMTELFEAIAIGTPVIVFP